MLWSIDQIGIANLWGFVGLDGFFCFKSLKWSYQQTQSAGTKTLGLNTNPVADHQLYEPVAVYQRNLFTGALGRILSFPRESAGSDKHSLGSAPIPQGAHELLDIWTSDCILVAISLGLDVNPIQAQGILVQDAVNSSIT